MLLLQDTVKLDDVTLELKSYMFKNGNKARKIHTITHTGAMLST